MTTSTSVKTDAAFYAVLPHLNYGCSSMSKTQNKKTSHFRTKVQGPGAGIEQEEFEEMKE